MAYTFPIYTDITGAQIIAVVSPRTSLGGFTADVIDHDKTTNTTNSTIGIAIDSFNDWFTQKSIVINDVSDSDGAKVTLALKLYIAGKYLESDKLLTSSDDESYPYPDIKFLYDKACTLLAGTAANITGIADFCTYGDDNISPEWESEVYSKCKGKAVKQNNSSASTPTNVQTWPSHTHDDRYYTESEADTRFALLSHNHNDLYYTETESDARFALLAHTHAWGDITGKPTFATVATSGDYNDLSNQPTIFSGDYNDLSNKPTIPSNTNDITEGTNLYFTNERVDDRVNDLLVEGANITLTYDDVANTLTIASAGGGGGGNTTIDSDLNYIYGDGGQGLVVSSATNNYLAGDGSGDSITSGDNNVFIGNGNDSDSGSRSNAILIGKDLTADEDSMVNIGGIVRVRTVQDVYALGANTATNLPIANRGFFLGGQAYQYGTGNYNVAIGVNALKGDSAATPADIDGASNIAIGDDAMREVSLGATKNVVIGDAAAREITSGSQNVILGKDAAREISSASDNFIAGFEAGYYVEGDWNVFIGLKAGKGSSGTPNSGGNNIAIGESAGEEIGASRRGIYMGYNTGAQNVGDGNVLIGHRVANDSTTIANSVIIGFQAGYTENISNRLVIANSNTTTPLIDGRFDTSILTINGQIETTEHLTLAEVTTPTAEASKGKIYTKADNKLYFQSGDGTENEIAFV